MVGAPGPDARAFSVCRAPARWDHRWRQWDRNSGAVSVGPDGQSSDLGIGSAKLGEVRGRYGAGLAALANRLLELLFPAADLLAKQGKHCGGDGSPLRFGQAEKDGVGDDPRKLGEVKRYGEAPSSVLRGLLQCERQQQRLRPSVFPIELRYPPTPCATGAGTRPAIRGHPSAGVDTPRRAVHVASMAPSPATCFDAAAASLVDGGVHAFGAWSRMGGGSRWTLGPRRVV